jgi:CelD/BcsL family acetyltransferase involved in cellulose biosynthesis
MTDPFSRWRNEPRHIEVFRSFQEAEKTWRDFQQVAASYVFQHYDWQLQWFRHIGPPSQWDPVITVVRDETAVPLLLLPLGIRRVAGVRILSWMGGTVTDYQAPLIRGVFPGEAPFAGLWSAILDRLRPVDIVEFAQQPPKVGGFPNPFLELGGERSDASLAVELTGDWESFRRQRLTKKFRLDSDRRRRQLDRIGEVRFVVAAKPHEFDELLDATIRQKRRKMAEMTAHDFLASPGYREFYKELTRDWGPLGKVHLSALYCGSEIIATQWAVSSAERFYCLMRTFAGAEWSRYSPGRLLTEFLMQWAFSKGIPIFDFTIGTESYKYDWCDQETPLYSYQRILTPKGRLFATLQELKGRLRNQEKFMRMYRTIRHRLKLY